MSKGYVAFILKNTSRSKLLSLFPPKYDKVIAHHVTYQFGVNKDNVILPEIYDLNVVGYANDENGIEALIVEFNGTTKRLDGGTYHITWSLDHKQGYKPKHSNDLISRFGWEELQHKISINASVEFISFNKG